MKWDRMCALALLVAVAMGGAAGCYKQDSAAADAQTVGGRRDAVTNEAVAIEEVMDAARSSDEGAVDASGSQTITQESVVNAAAQATPSEQDATARDTSAANTNDVVKSPSSDLPAATSDAHGHDPVSHEHAPSSDLTEAYAAAEADEVLFEGWPTPRTTLVFTGRQYGYLEPCGCAGLEHQKGGLVRRYALLQELKAKGWHPVPVDAGNQVRRFGRQPEIKFQMTIESLRMMNYRAIAFGPDDLGLPAGELVAIAAGDDQNPSPFVSANVVLFDPSFTPAYQVVESNGMKIGITAILGKSNQKKVNNGDVIMRDAAEALTEVWPQLAAQSCDFYVLVAHASNEESIALGKQFPQFSAVLTTGGAGEPMRTPEVIQGTETRLIQVGTKGMFAGVVGLFDDPAEPLRYQRVPLDGRFKDTDVMLGILAAYQDRLKEIEFQGLGIRAQRHPTGRTFVGSEVCADCHSAEYDIWKEGLTGEGGPHAKAYHTLLHPPERSHIARNFDPECISCHVVGWNSQKYFPYESGYVSQEETPDKLDVGCENCHSPGSAHVEAEYGDVDLTDEEIDQRRQQMVLPLDQAEQKCLECHDLDNSPNFHEKGAFSRYWKKIRH